MGYTGRYHRYTNSPAHHLILTSAYNLNWAWVPAEYTMHDTYEAYMYLLGAPLSIALGHLQHTLPVLTYTTPSLCSPTPHPPCAHLHHTLHVLTYTTPSLACLHHILPVLTYTTPSLSTPSLCSPTPHPPCAHLHHTLPVLTYTTPSLCSPTPHPPCAHLQSCSAIFRLKKSAAIPRLNDAGKNKECCMELQQYIHFCSGNENIDNYCWYQLLMNFIIVGYSLTAIIVSSLLVIFHAVAIVVAQCAYIKLFR